MKTNPESDNSGSKTCPNSSTTPISMNPNSPDDLYQAYQTLYQASPFIKLSHFLSSQAILESLESKQHVHVIDLDIRYGFQWPPMIQALAARPGGPPFLRITGIGFPLESIKETGRLLDAAAKSSRVPFEFIPVEEAEIQNLTPNVLQVHDGEAIAVNLVNWPRHEIGDCLGRLLTMMRDQGPRIVTLTEQEPSLGEPTSLAQFTRALHYYTTIFESLDAALQGDSPARKKVEQCIFAPKIKKEASEELERGVRRREGLDGTVELMGEKGFQNVPAREEVVAQAKMLLSMYGCSGYTLTEHKGCLQLGWRGTTITTTSAWRC